VLTASHLFLSVLRALGFPCYVLRFEHNFQPSFYAQSHFIQKKDTSRRQHCTWNTTNKTRQVTCYSGAKRLWRVSNDECFWPVGVSARRCCARCTTGEVNWEDCFFYVRFESRKRQSCHKLDVGN